MKIKYLQLKQRLNIPGISGEGIAAGNKISANGKRDGTYRGQVTAIHQAPFGYVLEIASGPQKGFYEVPFFNVEHAGTEYTLDEQQERFGSFTPEQYQLYTSSRTKSDAELFEAGVARDMLNKCREEFGAYVEPEPKKPAKKSKVADGGQQQPQTEPATPDA